MTTATAPIFQEMQSAELAWWVKYMKHATAKERMYSLYGARYFGYFFPELHGEGALIEIGSGPLPVALMTHATQAVLVDSLWPEYQAAGITEDGLGGLTSTGELPGGQADYVLLLNVLDHTDEPEALVLEARRLLKPGGRALVYVHLEARGEDHRHAHVSEDDVIRWFSEWHCERQDIFPMTVYDPPAFVGVYIA